MPVLFNLYYYCHGALSPYAGWQVSKHGQSCSGLCVLDIFFCPSLSLQLLRYSFPYRVKYLISFTEKSYRSQPKSQTAVYDAWLMVISNKYARHQRSCSTMLEYCREKCEILLSTKTKCVRCQNSYCTTG